MLIPERGETGAAGMMTEAMTGKQGKTRSNDVTKKSEINKTA